MSCKNLVKGAALLFMLVSVSTAIAAPVTLTTQSGGNFASGSLVYTGDILWTNLAQQSVVASGTIIGKTFTGIGTLDWQVDFAGVDFDVLGSGLRLVETVTNSTGVAWTDYHLSLSATDGVFFGDVYWSPSFVTVGAGQIPSVTVNSKDGLTVSTDGKSVDIVFGAPIANGESFSIYAPIVNLNSAPGAFELSQTPTVPVPAAVWAGLALLGGLGISRKMRRAG